MKKRYLAIFIVLIIMVFRVHNVFAADLIEGVEGGPLNDQSAPHIIVSSSPIDIKFYEGIGKGPVFFKIVPANSVVYTFESKGNLDTQIVIYDQSGAKLDWLYDSDGDTGGDSVGDVTNFKVSIGLNESKVYYIAVWHNPFWDHQPEVSHATLQITGGLLLAPPNVTTYETATSSITNSMAEVGGNVVNDNGYTVNDRGIVYIEDSLGVEPTLENATKVQAGIGIGEFSPVKLSSLPENTTYRYCSYAINSQGTSYGNIYKFTTLENVVPSLTNLDGDTLIFEKETSSMLLDKNLDATVSDSDSSHFGGGNLTVSIESGCTASEDSLIIQNQGTAEGEIGLSGNDVTYGGVAIGTFTGGIGNNSLVITFNNNATSASAISALLKSIAYENSNTVSPSTVQRTIRLTVTDETGETSSPAYVKVYFCSILGDPTSALTEMNLHGNTITLTVTGDTFSALDGTLDASKFTLNHSPAGNLTIGHAEKRDSSTVILTLAYIRTDFDADITNFSISVSGDLFTYGFPLTTKVMPITAEIEDLPISQSISIIPNTPSTNNRNVSLSLSAIHATQMIISEYSNFSDASYEPYQTNKNFVLSEGDGLKTVYVKFKNEDGDESTPISKTITLDTEAPTNTSISINSSSAYTNKTAVNLTLSATDASEMVITEDSSFNTATYVPFSNSTSFNLSSGDGTKTIYVKYKDSLGNETIPISNTITLDTSAPLPGSSGILSSSSLSLEGVTLNWTKATDTVTAGNNLIYSIYQSKTSMNTIDEVKSGNCIAPNLKDINTYSIAGLSAGETYYFNILVQDEAGHEACYTTIQVTTLSKSTISPTTAVFDKNSSKQADLQVTLALNGNTLDSISYNGAPLTLGADYLLLGSTATIKKEYLATQPKDSTVTLIFTFSAGESQTLNITLTDSTPTVPDSPIGVTAITTENSKVLVSFMPPSDGGSPILLYKVTSSPDNIVATGVTSPILVTGLKKDSAYTFTVTAQNALGESISSVASNSIVPILPLTDAECIDLDLATLEISYILGDNVGSVTGNISLPTIGINGSSITWNSSNPSIITSAGKVTRPSSQNVQTVLTATLIKNGETRTKTFMLTVIYLSSNSNGGSSGSGGSSTPKPEIAKDHEGNIEINGKNQEVATVILKVQDGKTVETFVLDEKKLEEELKNEGQKAVVTILTTLNSEVVVGEIKGQLVKNMAAKEVVLELKTPTASYILPVQQINIDSVLEAFGEHVALVDVKVSIEIAKASEETVKAVKEAGNKDLFTLVAQPVIFDVKCNYNGQSIVINHFTSYVERTIALSEGVNPNKISTGVVIELDGTPRHVPTKVEEINGTYYAKINSLTNSPYAVVWHPINFKDIEKHWAKEVINDMGSRMIITGVGNGNFEPDRTITRAEFATILINALGLKPGIGNNPFEDVKEADWYCTSIETATNYHLISGYGEGKFGPMDPITREQAMIMIARATEITKLISQISEEEIEDLLLTFGDATKAAPYAKNSVALCIKEGLVNEQDGNMEEIKGKITRAEVAVIINRLLKKSNLI